MITTHVPHRGFTLVEMLVALALFTVVMTISVGALLDMINANRKAQAMQSVMNNLNIALDGIVRNVRMGTRYHCGSAREIAPGTLALPQNCLSGGELIAFEAFGGNTGNVSDQWVYWIGSDKRLYKSEDSRRTEIAITAPEVEIDTFRVYVTGAASSYNASGDTTQPKVVFVLKGTAAAEGNTASVVGTDDKVRTSFTIQAVATQRQLDL